MAVFGGGGGDGGGGGNSEQAQADAQANSASARQQAERDQQAQADAQAQADNQARAEAIGQPPATTSFGFGPTPSGAMPADAFSTANNPGLTLNDASLATANSANIAAPAALAAMGSIPSPQMAADLAAMGGVPAPAGTPTPPSREAGLSNVDMSFNAYGPTMQSPTGTGNVAAQFGLTGPVVDTSTLDIKNPFTANFGNFAPMPSAEAPIQVAEQQTPPAPAPAPQEIQPPVIDTTGIMGKFLGSFTPKAVAADNPPELNVPNFPDGIIPTPPTLEYPSVPMPPSNPAYSAALTATPPAPAPAPTPTTTPFEEALSAIITGAPKNLTNTAVGFVPGAGLVNTVSGLFGGPTVGGTLFPDSTPAKTATSATTYSQPSLTDAQYRDLMNQPGWGSEDPSAIASFNNYNANTYGNLSGPTTVGGELAVGQRTPQTMVPKVNPDGTVTMVPNLGSSISSFLEDIFNPSLTKVGSPAYIQSTQPHAVNTEMASGGNGSQAIIPPIIPPTAPIVAPKPIASTPTVTAPSTLASNFARKYLGAPSNPLRYGYGPENAFYATAAKGGAVGPLNMMMRKP